MKDIADMTIEELNALPEYGFGKLTVKFAEDGTATLPNGRVIRGTPGHYINIPYRPDVQAAYWVGDKTPLGWHDNQGVWWRPVKLVTGEWRKERS